MISWQLFRGGLKCEPFHIMIVSESVYLIEQEKGCLVRRIHTPRSEDTATKISECKLMAARWACD